MSIEDNIKHWEQSIRLAEQHGLLLDVSMAKDILDSLTIMRAKYKNLVTCIITAIDENKNMEIKYQEEKE